MLIRKIVGKLHLWLGFSSGLVVFIVALTGCVFAFEEEFFNAFHPDLVFVQRPVEEERLLSMSVLQERVQRAIGGKDTITLFTVYPEKDRAWEFDIIKYDEQQAARSLWAHGGMNWKKAFVNPYSGEINGVLDMKYEFFVIVRAVHQHLFLNPTIGSPIVGTATIIFIILLLSGLVLWWPRNKAAARQRFAFRWKNATRWKRKNYDLHAILGFYILILGLFIALTGIVWSFDWWENTIYRILDGKVVQFKLPKNPDKLYAGIEPSGLLDLAVMRIQQDNPSYTRIFLSRNKSANTLMGGAAFKDNTLWSPYNYYMYNLSTGEEFDRLLQKNKTTGQKWRNSNYDLHTGKTLGYTGMTIAFFISLICTSLPITGFYIWWGRKKRKM